MSERSTLGLGVIMLIISMIIGGSIVFLGMQFMEKKSSFDDKAFEDAIEKYIEKQNRPPEAGEVKPVSDRDYVRGNRDAEISFIEYSDFECPFCKKSYPTVRQILEHYQGKVNWVYRHYPLNFHDPLATKQAEAVECAGEISGNDAFWKLHDEIFKTTSSNGRGMEIADLPMLAERAGVNRSQFEDCLESGKYKNYVTQAIEEGSKAGVRGTPGNIIVNNKTGKKVLVSGAQPFESFKQEIDAMLE